MTATAVRSSLFVTAFSIRSHTISKLMPGSTSLISSSTRTAAASLPALRDTRGYRRSFSSLDSRSALGQQFRRHHRVEQLQGVVGRPRRQRQHRRDQHRQAVLARHSPQQGRLARNAPWLGRI